MTIKPVGSQKSVDGGKKDSHGHVQVVGGESSTQNVGRSTHRSVVIETQPPQRRDVYEEISRIRRSPHKSSGRCKREHHKREREREKITTSSQKCNSPHHSVFGSSHGNKSPADQSTHTASSGRAPSPSIQIAGNILKAVEDACSGYNSGDEHVHPKDYLTSVEEWKLRDEQFDKLMSENGFIVKNVEEDGACLFRAISLQIYGDEDMHDCIRQQTMDYIYQNREYFSHFVTEDINSYIKRKRRKDSHGNHIEIQAISEIYNRPVELYCYKSKPINIFNSEQLNKGYPPLRLSYQRGSHYNAILDPYDATVGVGLGLSGYKPELQTRDAVLLSEQLEIEQTMFEDKLKTTDWEATNEAIEEQIARESYLQWCRENIQRAQISDPSTGNNYNNSHPSSSNACIATTSATVTSAQTAPIASPSKHFQKHLRNSTCTITNENVNTSASSNASTCPGSCGTTPLASPTTATATTASPLTVGNLSPKSLAAFGKSLRKDSELCFDSDDTDMSSTSSIDHPPNEKRIARGKKSKCRTSNTRVIKRRRREMIGDSGNVDDNEKTDGEQVFMVGNQNNGVQIYDSETKCSRPSTPVTCTIPSDNMKLIIPLQSPSGPSPKSPKPISRSVKCGSPSSSPGTSKQSANQDMINDSSQSPPLSPSFQSTFYQSLLESSYDVDGFAQLSESEMLQQAIQLSTQEYLEDQKRKGGFLR